MPVQSSVFGAIVFLAELDLEVIVTTGEASELGVVGKHIRVGPAVVANAPVALVLVASGIDRVAHLAADYRAVTSVVDH